MYKKIIAALLGFFALIVVLTVLLSRQLDEIVDSGSPGTIGAPETAPAEESRPAWSAPAASVETEPSPFDGMIIKRSRIEAGSDLIEHTFWDGTELLGQKRIYADGRVEVAGNIPEGAVKIVNGNNEIIGEEYYADGMAQGMAQTYYPSGQVQAQTEYRNDRVLTAKEYYADGKVRFEVDYRDAIDIEDKREAGIGKLYYPNGNLKYEWNLTKSNTEGYKRSYNIDGTLRSETIYDHFGNKISQSP